jgi:hypothetical protein
MAAPNNEELNPLYVLRKFTLENRLSEVTEDGEYIVFGDVLRVKNSTKTCYKDRGEYVTIMSAMLVAKKNKRFQYIAEMNKRKNPKFIGNDEMQDLQDYLTGVTDDSVLGNIEHDVEDQHATKRQRTNKGAVSGTGDSMNKKTRTPSSSSNSTKHKTNVNQGQIAFEMAGRDRNQLLMTPGQDYSYVLKIYDTVHSKQDKESSFALKPIAQGIVIGSGGNMSHLKNLKDPRLPIIIVPGTSSSIISMFNIKQFLSDSNFIVGSTVASKGDIKPNKQVVTRNIQDVGNAPNKKFDYLVIDNPSRLKPEDWERVVCVISLGKDWQFKGWKWSTPVELFSHVLGIYMKFDNEAIPALVAKWNVKILDISKNRRNLDATSNIKFWAMLDQHTRVNNPKFHRSN